MDKKTGNAKGSVFINVKEYILSTEGQDAWNRILNNLSVSDRKILDGNIIKSEWYPAPLLTRLIKTYDLLVGKGDLRAVTPIAEHIASKDLKPLFDAFVDLNNPNIVLNNTPALWSRYFDSGRLELDILDLDNNFSILHLYEVADQNRASGVAICNFAVPKWLKLGLLLCGASSVNIVHTSCRYKGAEFCKYEVTWE